MHVQILRWFLQRIFPLLGPTSPLHPILNLALNSCLTWWSGSGRDQSSWWWLWSWSFQCWKCWHWSLKMGPGLTLHADKDFLSPRDHCEGGLSSSSISSASSWPLTIVKLKWSSSGSLVQIVQFRMISRIIPVRLLVYRLKAILPLQIILQTFIVILINTAKHLHLPSTLQLQNSNNCSFSEWSVITFMNMYSVYLHPSSVLILQDWSSLIKLFIIFTHL